MVFVIQLGEAFRLGEEFPGVQLASDGWRVASYKYASYGYGYDRDSQDMIFPNVNTAHEFLFLAYTPTSMYYFIISSVFGTLRLWREVVKEG